MKLTGTCRRDFGWTTSPVVFFDNNPKASNISSCASFSLKADDLLLLLLSLPCLVRTLTLFGSGVGQVSTTSTGNGCGNGFRKTIVSDPISPKAALTWIVGIIPGRRPTPDTEYCISPNCGLVRLTTEVTTVPRDDGRKTISNEDWAYPDKVNRSDFNSKWSGSDNDIEKVTDSGKGFSTGACTLPTLPNMVSTRSNTNGSAGKAVKSNLYHTRPTRS